MLLSVVSLISSSEWRQPNIGQKSNDAKTKIKIFIATKNLMLLLSIWYIFIHLQNIANFSSKYDDLFVFSVTDLEVKHGLKAADPSKCIWMKRTISNIENELPTPESELHNYIGRELIFIDYLKLVCTILNYHVLNLPYLDRYVPLRFTSGAYSSTLCHEIFVY